MKETKKAIPFLVAACVVFGLFHFNPDEEAHIAKIKAEYIEHNPMTWRATWWSQALAFDYQDYLFFSVVKQKERPISLGVLGLVVLRNEKS